MSGAEVLDITLPESRERSLVGVYLKIILLPVVVFVVFLLGFLGVIALKVELHSIIMLGILLIITLVLARHNAEYGCSNFENNIENFKSELKDYIVSNLLSIGYKKKSDAKFDYFVDEYGYSLRNQNYASVAAGVFPMLGILGTFISIAISMPRFSSTNIDGLETEIAQLLGGVGTAFYVSIYGIFLALWWIYFEKKGITKFERLLIKYKNATKSFFWGKDEIIQSYLSEILDRNAEVSRSFMSLAASNFGEKLNRAIDEKMGILQSLIDAEQSSIALTQNELEKANEMILNANLTHGEMSKNYGEILTTLKAISNNIVEVQNGISTQYLEISKISNEKAQAFENVAGELNMQMKNFCTQVKSLNETTINEQIAAREGMRENFKELNDELKAIFSASAPKQSNADIIDELRKTLASIDEKAHQDEE